MKDINQEIPVITTGEGSKQKISTLLLRKYLESEGFGQFMTTNDRTTKRFFFLNDENVLRIFSADNIRAYVIKNIETFFEGDDIRQALILSDLMSRFSSALLESQVLVFIQCFGELDNNDYKKMELASDDPNTCFIRFLNGVVVINKDAISLISYSHLGDQGAVWENSIIRKNIEINEKKGLYEQFCLNAMRVRDPKVSSSDGDWKREYPVSNNVQKNFKSLRSSIGYLLHADNTIQKAVVYIDRNSTITKEEGGNGKTVVMKSIQYFRDRMSVNGKQFYKGTGGDRFAFSGVTPSTGLIHIDDIDKNFDFKSLFAFLTGDLETEGKGTNKVIITEDRKPKFGITTNYVLQGGGQSHARRQHIVEFGDYWNRCNKQGEAPWEQEHLGKRLFNDFSQDDWNQFYTFGFKCIQLFLREGLVDGAMGLYEEKQLATSVASEPEVQEWIRNYVMERRVDLNHQVNGVADYALHALFAGDIDPTIAKCWGKTRLMKALHEYVSKLDGYDWNPHKSGNTMSDRRFLVKEDDGIQRPYIKIVSDSDSVAIVAKPANDEDFDSERYFTKLLCLD
tara:strand:- start:485 stop:2182 length:1698 start_codon:yes stop_codon:yes gene_type:complete